MKRIWVLVADEAIARILERPEVGDELEPVEELTDPAAHASGAELRRDAHGRRSGSAPTGGHEGAGRSLRGTANTTASAGEAAQHREAEDFARRVAQRLAEALQQDRFDELRVAAAPRFLGRLRQAWSPQVAAVITEEIDKDLIHSSQRDITDRMLTLREQGPR